MLPDNLSFKVALYYDFLFGLTGFRIDHRHSLLSSSGLSAAANPGRFYRGHGSSAGPAFGDEIHDATDLCRLIAREYLIQNLGRTISFDLRLHQTAFQIRGRGNDQSHLKWRHLRRVSLAVTFIHQFAARRMLAGFQP